MRRKMRLPLSVFTPGQMKEIEEARRVHADRDKRLGALEQFIKNSEDRAVVISSLVLEHLYGGLEDLPLTKSETWQLVELLSNILTRLRSEERNDCYIDIPIPDD